MAVVGLGVQDVGARAEGRYERSRDWVLEIDGEPEPGVEIYFSRYDVAWLLEGSALGSATLLIRAREESVDALTEADMHRDERGVTVTGSAAERIADAAVDSRSTVRFELVGRPVVLKPAPPLLGFQTTDVLDWRHLEFETRRSHFVERSGGSLRRQRSAVESIDDSLPLTVRVYFGSWSSACRRVVPKIQAVEAAWKGIGLRFEYYGLPQPLTDDQHAVDRQIRGVPTLIVLGGEEEIGRLAGRPLDTPAESLLALLSSR